MGARTADNYVDEPLTVVSQPTTVNLGELEVAEKPISAETESKLADFKLLMAKKGRTDDEDREMKFEALDLYNEISRETGRPPVIHLADGVSFEQAFLASLQ